MHASFHLRLTLLCVFIPSICSAVSLPAVVNIVNQNSHLCLADPASSVQLGTQMVQWPCKGYDDQKWTTVQNSNGTFKFINVKSNLCLDYAYGSAVDGTPIIQWACDPNNGNQNFTVTQSPAGQYQILTSAGHCIDIYQWSTTPGTKVEEWQCSGGGNQAFAFNAVNASPTLPPPTGYSVSQLTFNETFQDSVLNRANWNPWIGNDQYGRWSDLGNLLSPYSGANMPNAYQLQVDDPFPAGGGTDIEGQHLLTGSGLRFISSPSQYFSGAGYSWASAGISSYGKVYLPATGGYVQFSAKMPDSSHGAWMGLWFLGKSNGPEIDLNESGYICCGVTPNNVVSMSYHGASGETTQNILNTGVDTSADYHTYGMEYNPGHWIKMYFDGRLMAQWFNNIPSDSYELLIDLEMAGSNTTGWHSVSDTVNFPGPYKGNVKEIQIYTLH